jgi:hypothetical protein
MIITKKCMWCLKEFETDTRNQYCSTECKKKKETPKESDVVKKGFFAIIGDFFGSLFS